MGHGRFREWLKPLAISGKKSVSSPVKKSLFSWIPAFAGMTTWENVPFFVIPEKAGIQGAGR